MLYPLRPIVSKNKKTMLKTGFIEKKRLKTYYNGSLTLLVPIPDEQKKLSQIFIFRLLCDASRDFTKALKAFIKPFEVPQRSVKIKI